MSRTFVPCTFSGEWQTVWTTLAVRLLLPGIRAPGIVAQCGGVRVGPEADAGIEAHTKTGDGSEVFDVKDERHLEYWVSLPVDVYLVTLPGLKERRFG